MDDVLDRYVGLQVEVHYLTDNNMFSDKGRIGSYSERWLELVKESGKRGPSEVLLVPVSAIRIVKVADAQATSRVKDADVLLRPAPNEALPLSDQSD